MKTLNETVKIVRQELFDLYMSKVEMYGKKSILNFGFALCLTKMDSKKERLLSLTNRRDVDMSGESIEDTTKDLLGYALIWMSLIKKNYDLPFAKQQGGNTIGTYEEYKYGQLRRLGINALKEITSPKYHFNEEIIFTNVITLMQTISDEYVNSKMDDSKICKTWLYDTLNELIIQSFIYLLSIKQYLTLEIEKARKK